MITAALNLVLVTVAHAAPVDLGPALSRLEATLAKPLAVEDCVATLGEWTDGFAGSRSIADDPAATLARLFRVRQQLRGRLGAFEWAPGACVDQVRRTLSALRSAEDHLALAARDGAPAPGQARGSFAWLTTADGSGVAKLRSGDVLVSRGDTFTSAAIAKIGEVEGDFSHVAQVYIDAPEGTAVAVQDAITDPRVFTVESEIERGAAVRQFAAYVTDNHVRVAHFRPRQSARRAHHAAWSVYDWVKRWQRAHADAMGRAVPNLNDNPPYDFKMNLADPGEVFCAEIIRMGQATVGWTVPMYQTTLKKNSLTRTMGITVGTTFAPIDVEVDARFAQLAEWRDLDKLGTVLKRDVVFSHIFAELAAGRLSLKPTAREDALAVFGWTMRQADLAFADRMPKNMSPWILAMTFAIDRVGKFFEDQMTAVP